MNWKWYLPILLIALAFFGASMEQSTLPNQEIVVQFDASSVSTDEAQLAVAEITNQLKAIGVADVRVSELQGGKLKVTYYSTIDVSVIKNLFHKQDNLQLGDTAFNDKKDSSNIPFSRDSYTYKLDVIKIQKDYGSNIGLQGLPIVVKSAKDQYLKQIISFISTEIDFKLKLFSEHVAFKNYRNASFLIDVTSHKIPEVRAGPLS